MPVTVILCTAPGLRSAKKIASVLLKQRLAACVSMKEGWVSSYRWLGKIEAARETLMLIKTERKNFSKIDKAIRAIHPYSVPEILALPVTKGSSKYLSWMRNSLK
jgi:periplasmic divalent cation tolerance protein